MPEPNEADSDNQAAQRELVERGRDLPGVADLLEICDKLGPYTSVMVNFQPSQVTNATGGNAG